MRFRNLDGTGPVPFTEALRWAVGDKLAGRRRVSPDRAEVPRVAPDLAELARPPAVGEGARLTWLGHASWLVQLDGLSLLVDPVLGDRLPGFIRRNVPPGVAVDRLPSIDASLVSHNHYDHLDIPTLRRLGEAHNPRFFVGLGNAPILHEERIGNVAELDWWQTVELRNGVKLTAVPAQHGSNRGIADRNRTLWAGYVLEGQGGYAYFAGDTGFGPHFAGIRERFGRPRLAILPIGAFRPEWFMHPVHVSPKEAVRAHRVLGAHRSVGMHFGTFRLADDGQDEPVEQLAAARARAGVLDDHFWVLDFGEGRDVPAMEELP